MVIEGESCSGQLAAAAHAAEAPQGEEELGGLLTTPGQTPQGAGQVTTRESDERASYSRLRGAVGCFVAGTVVDIGVAVVRGGGSWRLWQLQLQHMFALSWTPPSALLLVLHGKGGFVGSVRVAAASVVARCVPPG